MRFLRQIYRFIVRLLIKVQPKPPAAQPLHDKRMARAVLLGDRLELLRRLPHGGTIMECGVDEGHFSQHILDICKPKQLLLVDTWGTARFSSEKLDAVSRRFEQQIRDGEVVIRRMLSTEALQECSPESLDWVYIDTSHDYHTTREELELAASRVRKDGIICGHDYTIGSWTSYIRYGVIEAVNEFCNKNNWDLIFLTNEPKRNLSYAIQRSSLTTSED